MRNVTNQTLNRRTLLRDLDGALALPLLDSMTRARATASERPVIRHGFVYPKSGGSALNAPSSSFASNKFQLLRRSPSG
jgi:hypothetical protein